MNSCIHKSNLPPSQTLFYCLTTSTFFVASLYLLVPPSVRRLPRDDTLHIQWRSGVILLVVLVCLLLYPWLFCHSFDDDDDDVESPPFYVYLGIVRETSLAESIVQNVKILVHVMILYLGSFACTWMRIYHYAQRLQQHDTSINKNTLAGQSILSSLPEPNHLYKSIQQTFLQPKLHSFQQFKTNLIIRWITLRNLLIAPIAEELIFRSILLPPLLSSSGYTNVQCCWMAPLFFGVAHFHHYYMKRYEGFNNYKQLMIGLLCQWSYTTLFGAYASHVFVRTGSVWGICVVHSFCNYMGLPEVEFVSERSVLFRYKLIIGSMYGVGIWMFWKGFDSRFLIFPEVSVLPELLAK